jgi:preprotein translocase subunit SecB
MQPQKQPEVQINVDVKARSLGQDLYEVLLTISAEAKSENEPVFMVELAYGAVVTAKADNQDVLPLLILVEAPRIIFPFARNIIAEATRDGGFPPLMLNPIDFSELLRRQQQKAAAEQPTATA